MDDNFNEQPEKDIAEQHAEQPVNTEEPVQAETVIAAEEPKQQYTDPNAGQTSYSPFYQQNESNSGNYNYNANYKYNGQNNYQEEQSVLSMGEWLLTILVMFIPCIGLGVYIYWAVSKTGNLNRRNFCRAQLIVTVAGTIIGIILSTVLVAAVMPYIGQYYY